MLEVFDNDSSRHILRVSRRDCVPSVELRRRLCLTAVLELANFLSPYLAVVYQN